jgi:broad specificity phosphatase PhoE
MSADPSLCITLLRHARSTANRDGVLQGQRDYPLDELGQNQAKLLAKYWLKQNRKFDLIVSSTLMRAQDTARIIADSLALGFTSDPRWIERKFGEAEGISTSDFRRSLHEWEMQEVDGVRKWNDIETDQEIFSRVTLAFKDLLNSAASKILVVSHGGTLNVALRYILGSTPSNDQKSHIGFRFNNTGFTEILYEPEPPRWHILNHNSTPHLEILADA